MTPLVYVHRKHDDANSVIQACPFRDTDHKYSKIYLLQSALFNAESKKYYEILKHMLIAGLAWTFIRSFEKASNGQGAILDLVAQTKVNSARKSRYSAAYHDISVVRYRGPTRNFTLDDCIAKHSNAYAELLDL